MKKQIVSVEIASAVFPEIKPSFEKVRVVVDENAETLRLPMSVIIRLRLRQIGMTRRLVHGVEKQILLYGPLWLRVGKRTISADTEATQGRAIIGPESMKALDVQLQRTDETSAAALVPKHKNARHVSAPSIR